MKKITSVFLALLMLLCLFTFGGCGKKNSEKSPAELLVGDWYTYSGAPYRSFSGDGTVTGTDSYSSPYTVEGDNITWNTQSGRSVTVGFWTDGELLRISSDIGAYFTTRRYYCRSAEGIPGGTGLPEKGTVDEKILGSWYDGDTLFFTLGDNGVLSNYRDMDSFCFTGDELVLFAAGASSDEAAECSLSDDKLTVYYTDELTGNRAELVLERGSAVSASDVN